MTVRIVTTITSSAPAVVWIAGQDIFIWPQLYSLCH